MPINKSIVLSCAGIGSRLGFNQNKSLIDILGKPLIYWQLDYFKKIEDLRIVVGYQAEKLIEEVSKIRNNVTFVYNNNYSTTKTGTSFYLGAKNAKNKYIIEWDGDLLVYPNDAQKCIELNKEYIGYSDISSEESVYVKTNPKGQVLEFSRKSGNFEWTGPACILKNKIKYTTENVFNIIEDYLPMEGLKIKAQDIDTPQDYIKAIEFVKSWSKNNYEK